MIKTPMLGTGLSGLVGSRVVELLKSRYVFDDLSYDTGIDITDKTQVMAKIRKSDSQWIIHLAAKADVDGCEQDKSLGKEGNAWKINVEGTRNVVDAAFEVGKHVLYISTDFVFDGAQESYSETDTPRPISWYGMTKYEGEKLVLKNTGNLVMRIAYPYRAVCRQKLDFVHAVFRKLQKKEPVVAVADHVFTPTLADDIAFAIDLLIQKNESGVFHVVGSDSMSPYAAAILIASTFGFSKDLVTSTTMSQYYKDRGPRPYNLRIRNDRIVSLGIHMRPFSDGLFLIQEQGIE